MEKVFIAANLFAMCLLMVANPVFSADEVKSTNEIPLELLLFEEMPLISTATLIKQNVSQAPATVHVITADEIKIFGYKTVDEILRHIIGFYITNDKNYEHTGTRGVLISGDYSSRILTMINGNITNDAVYMTGGTATNLVIDPEIIKQIEIIKGPGSALYGTCALFAVINIITKDFNANSNGEISGSYDGNGKKHASLIYTTNIDELKMLFNLSLLNYDNRNNYYSEYDSPATNNGIFENSEGENAHRILTNFNYKDFSVETYYSQRSKFIPTSSYFTKFNDNRSKTFDSLYFITAGYLFNFDPNKSLKTKISYYGYEYWGDYAYVYQDMASVDYDEIFHDHSSNQRVGAELIYTWQFTDKNNLVLGYDYKNNFDVFQESYDKGITNPDYYYVYMQERNSTIINSFYAENIFYFLDNFHSVFGLRCDSDSSFRTILNPRIAFIFNPFERTTIKLLYGQAFRAPNFYEHYYNDGGNTAIANPDLNPEKLNTYEIIFEQKMFSDCATLNLSAYNTEFKDIISQTEIMPGISQYQNIDEVSTKGFEFNFISSWEIFRGRCGYCYQHVYNKTTNERLTGSPQNMATAGISVPLLNNRLIVSADLLYIDKVLSAGGAENTWMDQKFLMDIILFSSEFIKNLEMTLKVSNVFDKKNYDAVSEEFLQTSIAQDGRVFSGKIAYKF